MSSRSTGRCWPGRRRRWPRARAGRRVLGPRPREHGGAGRAGVGGNALAQPQHELARMPQHELRVAQVVVARVGRFADTRAAVGRPVPADHRHRARLARLLAGAGPRRGRGSRRAGSLRRAARRRRGRLALRRRRPRRRSTGGPRAPASACSSSVSTLPSKSRRSSRSISSWTICAAVLPALGFTRSLPAYALQARKRSVSRSSSSSVQPASRSTKSIAPRIEAPWRRSGCSRDSRPRSTANAWKPARSSPRRRHDQELFVARLVVDLERHEAVDEPARQPRRARRRRAGSRRRRR